MSKVLVVHDGKRERELLLVERLVVGRDPACDISVDDGLLSRRHAEFIAAPAAVTVRDLGSRNGIFVNGTRRAEQSLKPGDVVQIGPFRVRYLQDRAAAAIAAAPVDADGTRMIPGPAPASMPAPTAWAAVPAAPDFDPMDSETRFVSAGELEIPPEAAPPVDDDATGFVPAPPRPMAPPDTLIMRPAPSVPEAPVVAAPAESASPLGSFVLIQLGALAVIVFAATVAPIVVSRGTVLSAITEGRLAALLIWPVLPLIVALAATLVIARIINRRVLDVLGTDSHDMEGR